MKARLFFLAVRITKRLTWWAWQYEIVQIKDLQRSLEWSRSRCDALQKQQSQMRDPERTWVCDILANGFTSKLRKD